MLSCATRLLGSFLFDVLGTLLGQCNTIPAKKADGQESVRSGELNGELSHAWRRDLPSSAQSLQQRSCIGATSPLVLWSCLDHLHHTESTQERWTPESGSRRRTDRASPAFELESLSPGITLSLTEARTSRCAAACSSSIWSSLSQLSECIQDRPCVSRPRDIHKAGTRLPTSSPRGSSCFATGPAQTQRAVLLTNEPAQPLGAALGST